MTTKADSRLAEFLRRILASDNDAAPAEVIYGPDATSEVQLSAAQQFASTVHEMGHIEPAGGQDHDQRRVRVTPQGRDWLEEYGGRAPTLHPRFSS